MTDMATISGSTARAAEQRALYRRFLGINLSINALIALAAILAPSWLNALLGQPALLAKGWVMLWGIALLFLTLLYLPGWLNPSIARLPNLIGLAERGLTGIALLIIGSGFAVLGLYMLASAAVLGWTYYRFQMAELATRP